MIAHILSITETQESASADAGGECKFEPHDGSVCKRRQ